VNMCGMDLHASW